MSCSSIHLLHIVYCELHVIDVTVFIVVIIVSYCLSSTSNINYSAE